MANRKVSHNSVSGQTISHHRIVEEARGGGIGVGHKAETLVRFCFATLKFLPEEIPLEETYETSH